MPSKHPFIKHDSITFIDTNNREKDVWRIVFAAHLSKAIYSLIFPRDTSSSIISSSCSRSRSTVKPVLNPHSKTDRSKILVTNGSLMKVKRIAECSPLSILQYF